MYMYTVYSLYIIVFAADQWLQMETLCLVLSLHLQMADCSPMCYLSHVESLVFISLFIYSVFVFGNRFLKTKRPGGIIPLIPFGFVGAYYYDLAYGSKVQRMQGETILPLFRILFFF